MFTLPVYLLTSSIGLLPTFADSSKPTGSVESVDIFWVIICAGLVFIMQPGFMCLESGLTRSKNSINVAVKNFADFGISVALFWAFGYALAFGVSYAGLVGTSDFFVKVEFDSATAAFFLFQTMFCGTATTIVSGAVAERMKFQAYLAVSCLSSGLIYPLFAHWVWARSSTGEAIGWLGKLGFSDFAGSTVVHALGGWVALASLLVIGQRADRFPEGQPARKIQGSDLPLSVLGTMLLWLGWLGFNGGSTLSLDGRVAGIMAHTLLAGTAGMLAAMAIGWRRSQVPEVELMINGSLTGLVSVTASCSTISTPAALAIGAVGGAIAVFGSDLMEQLEIDDAICAVPVHLGGGIWGTLALAIFGSPMSPELDLSRLEFLLVQLVGIAVCGIWAFGLSFPILTLLERRVFRLRVSPEEEKLGLNVSEHRATTETYDLLNVMESQARDPSQRLRVPVEPFTESGRIASRYNQVMDALDEAVNRNTAIVETARDAIVTFDSETFLIQTTNPSALSIFGYGEDEASMSGVSVLTLLCGERESCRESFDAVLKTGRGELIGRRLDGREFPISATVTLTELSDNAFYTATLSDISERRRSEREIARANREIRSLNGRLKAENLRLGAELDVSRHLQAMLLPKQSELREISDLDIFGFMDPAAEVGGDYYDVLVRGDRVQFGIGDVTGHGLESGVLTIMVQTAVRTLLENNETDLKCFIDSINRTLYGNIERMGCDKNITLSLLDYEEGVLTLCGQHEEVLIARSQGGLERLDTIDLGFPIGLEAEVGNFTKKLEVPLYCGDVVLLFTDGITEAESEEGRFYGIERLCATLERLKTESAESIGQAIVEDVRQHIGSNVVHDDITLLVIKRRQSALELDR